MIWFTQRSARTKNHKSITGPYIFPITWEPYFWSQKIRVKIAIVIGITHDWNSGETTFSHSTADKTDIAGVIIHSQKRSPVAKRRRNEIHVNFFAFCLWSTLRRAKDQPSPLLSALSANITYLVETKITKIQNIRLETPTIFS
jgi:hypothetical protein